MTLMAINSDPAVLKSLTDCLRELYPQDEVISFSDALLAVKHGYNNQVDIVFTAADMATLSGFEVMRLLRGRLGATLPVVMIADSDKYQRDTQKLMFCTSLVSPVTLEKLSKVKQDIEDNREEKI